MKYAMDQSKTDWEIFFTPESKTYKIDFFRGLNFKIGDVFLTIKRNTKWMNWPKNNLQLGFEENILSSFASQILIQFLIFLSLLTMRELGGLRDSLK